VGGLAAFLALLLLDTPLQHQGVYGARPALAAAVTALMAIWWISEALPIHWTACVPLVVFPAGGVFSPDPLEGALRTVLPYFDPYVFLFLGGMCIAAAMQQWSLHRRIALLVLRGVGTSPARILLGFLAATAFVSLWISNTATAAMMFPIGMAVIVQLEARSGGRRLAHFGCAVMLAIAYGANVGGIGTKIGTGPNGIFAGFLAQRGVDVGFLQFAAVGLPFVLLFLPVVWLALVRIGRRDALDAGAGSRAVAEELARLGPVRAGERVVLAVFVAAVALWIAGKPLTELASRALVLRLQTSQVEATVSMGAALLLLAWPVAGRRALELRALRAVSWRTLVLLGGGLSMAAGIEASGLSAWLGGALHALRDLPPLAQAGLASVVTVALSAVASNVATIAVMLNVLAESVSPGSAVAVLFAATIASSCDFALPAGTPPNAIVFGSGYVTIPRMARVGVVLDVAAALLAAAWCWLAVPALIPGLLRVAALLPHAPGAP
jgi:sodium-dependent dicarboxylate transporter 2/3/5